MKQLLLVPLMAVSVSCGATTIDDCTDYLEVSDASYAKSSLLYGDHWHSKFVPGPGSTNYVGSGLMIYGPDSGTGAHYPDVMVLADGGCVKESGDLTWPELRLENGGIYCWGSNKGLKGKVVVEATDPGNPAKLEIYAAGTYNQAHCDLKARLLGDSDSVLSLTRPTMKIPPVDFYYYVTGCTWDEFKGTCLVETNATLSFQSTGGSGNNSFAGKVVVKAGGFWLGKDSYGVPTTVWMTVGGLDLRDGSHFLPRADNTGRASLVVVTNELVLGKTDIRFVDAVVAPGGREVSSLPAYAVGGEPVKIPLFKLVGAAAAKDVDISQVTISDHPQVKTYGYPRQKALVCEMNGDGSKTISVKYWDDDIKWEMNTANTQKYDGSAFNPANADYWKDSSVPTSESVGAVYASKAIAFIGESDAATFSFPNLTFFPSTTIYLYCAELTVSNLVLRSNQAMFTHTGSATKHLRGRMTVLKGTPIKIYCYAGRTIYLDTEICGEGSLDLRADSSTAPQATVCLTAANTNFCGRMLLSWHFTGTGAIAGQSFPDPAKGWFTTLMLNDGRNLGGTYAGTDSYQSLLLGDWTKLTVDPEVSQVTLDEPTRGILISNDCAQVELRNGQTLAVKETITYHGRLLKLGAGTLALGGEARFTNGDPATDPTADLNRLVVSGGVVKVISPNAVNGLQVELSDGTALCVDASSAEMGDRGVVNTRWATPFISHAADGKVPVTVEGVAGETTIIAPLLTVGKEAAKDLELAVRRVRGFRTTVSTHENADETVTYVGTFEPKGLTLIFR